MIIKPNGEVPILYLFLYTSIKKKATREMYISHVDIMEIIRRRLLRFPKYVHYLVLKEMEELELIKKLGNTSSLSYELIGKRIEHLLKHYKIFP